MSKTLIFQKSFLICGIMCFDGCGNKIQSLLNTCIKTCKEKGILPSDAELIVDAEPASIGIHQLTLSIESDIGDFPIKKEVHSILSDEIKKSRFEVIDEQEKNETLNKQRNWINILINLLSMGAVLTLTALFPPSLFLTIGLTALTFISTAFTSREYLYAFFQNFRTKSFANMATTISLGWFLSMAHTLFHSISMPLASSFSMLFMNFIMPTMLITCINGMDEIKRLIIEKSKKNQLKGIKTLFPNMSETYHCYKLSPLELEFLLRAMNPVLESPSLPLSKEDEDQLHDMLTIKELSEEKRNLLRKGAVINVNVGECFPVDCILIKGDTLVDASLLTGEPHQAKKLWQPIPAGAINLGQKVAVYAVKNAYNSMVNTLLFRANRAKKSSGETEEVPKFAYFYTALIIMGLLGAVFTPIALGIATIPLLMQNIIGILFSVCPCTIAIAYQLPKLISLHHRSSKGIQLRDERLMVPQSQEIHTVVFDKTGTLTTGNSIVESSDIPIDSSLWQRIYLLEKAYGGGHPLAKAIQKYYETTINKHALFDEVKECSVDHKNRGLSARVQEKRIQIGSFDYLKNSGITLPQPEKSKIEQGFSAVCVAEDGIYKGIIYVKHEVRDGILNALTRLKKEGKKIIMLTGDNVLSAQGFNKQMNSIFEEEDIHAGQTPQDKEVFLKKILGAEGVNPKGVWFVGDGLNDAPCCRIVSEKGGVSCAMDSTDKSAFFTDITLNGSLDYVFKHNKLNHSLQQNIMQNKGILSYGTLAFLAFIISFSIAGIAVPPLIPMAMMLSTTFFVLFNSYRTQLHVDVMLSKQCPWYKKLLNSNVSIGLLLGVNTLFICSVLIATIATGGLALPIATFSSGVVMAFSSLCTLSAIALLGLFGSILSTAVLFEQRAHNTSERQFNSISIACQSSKSEQIHTSEPGNTHDFFLSGRFKVEESSENKLVKERNDTYSLKNMLDIGYF